MPFGRWLPGELGWPLVVAALLRLGLVVLAPVRATWDGAIYARAALELAEGRGYTWRILREGAPLVPTAFYPVGFPAWLAGLRLIGVTGTGALVVQALLGVVAVPIAWRIARRLGGRAAGVRAAWLAALWPGGVLYSVALLTEPLFLVLVGLATLVALTSRRRQGTRAAAMVGVILGLAAWVRPTALPIALLLGASVGRGKRSIATGLVSFVIALAILSPWTLRNQRELGAPVLASTNAGFNLLLGTVGRGAFGDLPQGIDCDRSLDEVHKDRCRRGLAIDRIVDDPLAWLGRGLLKLGDTFGHESTPAHYLADAVIDGDRDVLRVVATSITLPFWMLVFVAALRGGWLRRDRRALLVVLAPILAIAAVHFVFIGGDRYHAALAPMILALASVGLARCGASGQAIRSGRNVGGADRVVVGGWWRRGGAIRASRLSRPSRPSAKRTASSSCASFEAESVPARSSSFSFEMVTSQSPLTTQARGSPSRELRRTSTEKPRTRVLAGATIRGYIHQRLAGMNYRELLARDLELGTGPVEGAIKNLMQKRMGHGGVRWIKERAEALLQLRCIDANGDWDAFVKFVHDETRARAIAKGERVSLQQRQPAPLPVVAAEKAA